MSSITGSSSLRRMTTQNATSLSPPKRKGQTLGDIANLHHVQGPAEVRGYMRFLKEALFMVGDARWQNHW